MADIESNIRIGIDASDALSTLRNLQSQLSTFHQQLNTSGSAANAALSQNMQRSLMNNINATRKFSASLTSVQTSAESFSNALDRNKLSMGEYFRFGMASTKTFGSFFKNELTTLNKAARENVKTLQTQFIKVGRDANGAMQAIKIRPLTLDMKDYGTQVAMAAQKHAMFNQILKQGSTNLLNFGKNTQWAGRQLMVGFTIPLSIFATTAAKAFMEVEKQAIRFKRVYGDAFSAPAGADKALNEMKALASEFTKYGIAIEKTLELAADAAQMGLEGNALRAQVTNATRLAVLGEVEQQEALEATISITNAFGTATEQLTEKINFLNAVENQTVTAISDLTVAIPKAGPVVKQLGGDVEDLAFFLTAMKEGGINASEGANALKSGLASLINPTEKASEFMRGFGINVEGIVEANKGDVKGLVVDFATALDTLDPLNRARAIEQLFGKFQFSRLSTLFQNVIKEGTQASRVMSLTQATSAELAVMAERELKRVEDSPAYKFQKAIEDIKTQLVPLGAEFLKLVTPIVSFATDLLKQFNSMSDGTKQFVMAIIGFLGLIAPAAIMTFGLFANGIANIIKGFGVVRGIFYGVSGAGTDLANMTQYMTQEQLEAASAAGNLGQTHVALTNIFTSERSAIASLVDAYRAATAAMGAMNSAMPVPRVAPTNPPIVKIPGSRRVVSPGGTIVPNGLKDGIIRIPGPKGAGDIFPAMLAPGESVIPADVAEKNRGFIAAMIEGKIPGFVNGYNLPSSYAADPGNPARRRASISENFGKLASAGFENEAKQAIEQLQLFGASAVQARKLMANLNEAAKAGPESVTAWISQLKQSTKNVASGTELIATMKQQTGVGISKVTKNFTHVGGGAEYVDASGQRQVVKSELGMANFDAGVNRELATRGGSQVAKFIDAFDDAGIQKWNHSIIKGGGDVDQLSASIQSFNARVKQIIQESGASRIFDSQAQAAAFGNGGISVQGAFATARGELAENDPLRLALDASAATPRELRRQGAIARIPKDFDKGTASAELSKSYNSEMQSVGKDTAIGLISGYKKEMDQNSPSKKMFNLGLDTAKGLIQGVREGFKDATQVGGQLGNQAEQSLNRIDAAIKGPLPPGMPSPNQAKASTGPSSLPPIPGMPQIVSAPQVVSAAEQTGKAYGKKFVEQVDNKLSDMFTTGIFSKTRLAQAFKNNAISDAIAGGASGGVILTDRLGNEIDRSITADPIAASNANLIQTGDVSPNADNPLAMDENGNLILDKKGNPLTKEAYDKQLKKTDAARKRGSRASKAFGALATASMIAGVASGMDGQIGQVAQGLVGPLSALSGIAPILLALPAPLAALAAVVGIVAFSFMKWNEMLAKSREEGRKLGDALSLNTNKLIEMSKISGTVSATEERRKAQETQLSGESSKTRKFGMSFLESEAGKTIVEDINTLISSGLSKDESAAAIGRQLSTAIAQGVLTSSQARSIASALGEELQDYDFSAEIVGTITSIVGPNGERLEKEPLKVLLDIQSQNMDQLEQLSLRALDKDTRSDFRKDLLKGESFNALDSGVQIEVEKILKDQQAYEDGGFGGFLAGLSGLNRDLGFDIGGPSDTTKAQRFVSSSTDDTKLQSASVQLGINQIQQNQQLLDSLEKQYSSKELQLQQDLKLTADATKRKSIEKEISDLQKNRAKDIAALNASNSEAMTQITEMSKDFDPKVFGEAIKTSVLSQYAEDNPLRAFAEDAVSRLNELKDSNFKTTLQLQFASGELSIDAVNRLMGLEKTSPTVITRFNAIVDKRGMAAGGQVLDLMLKAGINDENMERYITVFSKFQTEESFNDNVEALSQIANMRNEYGFNIDLNATSNAGTLEEVTHAVNALKDQPDVLTKKQVMDLAVEDPATYNGLIENWNTIVGASDVINKAVIIDFRATGDLASINRYLNSLGLDARTLAAYKQSMAMDPEFANEIANKAAAEDIANGKNKDDETDPVNTPKNTDSGGDKADPFEDILKDLKKLRNYTIDVTGGWKELQRVLGKKMNMSIFKGNESLLLERGLSAPLSNYFASLDEETQKLYFKIGKDGRAVLTKQGELMKNAFDERTLGKTYVALQGNLTTMKQQNIAVAKLMNYGLSYKDAVEMASDAEVAAAIAAGKNAAEVKKIVDLRKEELALARKTALKRLEYSIKESITNIGEQQTAVTKLVAAGLSYKDAVELASDAEIAAAIATGQSADQLKTIVDLKREELALTQKTTAMNNLRIAKEEAAADAKVSRALMNYGLSEQMAIMQSPELQDALKRGLEGTTEFRELLALEIKKMVKADLKSLSDAVVQAVKDFVLDKQLKEFMDKSAQFSNVAVQGLIMNDSALSGLLRKAQEVGAVLGKEFYNRLNQLLRDPEALYSLFQDGMSKASDAFSVLEQQIEIKFKIDTKEYSKLISDAEKEIATINYEIDDFEASLKEIEDQEKSINDKYEERIKALDQVSQINAELSEQAKSQLDIASALTSGDIAAAARAVQEYRSQQAQDKLAAQRTLLEKSRERELGAVVSSNGMTRVQIEKEIKKLRDEIFQIEEKTLEPAQRALQLAENAKQIAVDNLTVLGMTRTEWDAIQNGVDLARINTAKFAAETLVALQAAQALKREYALMAQADITAAPSSIPPLPTQIAPPAGAPDTTRLPEDVPGTTAPQPGTTTTEPTKPVPEPEPEPEPTNKPKLNTINSSYAVIANAKNNLYEDLPAPLQSNAGVIDRSTAEKAAKAAVHSSTGLVAGGVTIKAASTTDFAMKVMDVVLSNRAAVQSGTLSDKDKKALTEQNIKLMQGSGLRFATGGMVPKYFASGGMLRNINTDNVPAMLTPGEFVVRRFAVEKFGADNLKAINNGTYSGGSVYNSYELNVNVRSDANPDQIARAVMTQIKQIDSQRIRGNRF